MADFMYRAVTREGEVAEGFLTADSQDAASRELRKQGLTPLQLLEGKQQKGGAAATATQSHQGKMPSKDDVLVMTNELAVLLRSGLPIDRSLKILIDMSHKEEVTKLLSDMLETVKGGKRLSQALEPYESVFGGFYISMIRSGETSGHLSKVMTGLVGYLEEAKAVRNSVKSAMTYPAILAVVATLSIIMMLGFVVPQFEALFSDMGDALPLLTRVIIGAGEWFKAYGLLMMIVVAVLVWLFKRWLKSPNGKEWLDKKLLSLPFFGETIFKYEIAKFSRTMGTLLGNGVSVLQSLSIAIGTVSNTRLSSTLEVLEPAVKQGTRMSVALEETDVFSPMVVQMVRVGEEAGNVDEMMLELAKVYDADVQGGISRSLTLLEPVMILGMGLVIGVIIVGILLGILSINDAVI